MSGEASTAQTGQFQSSNNQGYLATVLEGTTDVYECGSQNNGTLTLIGSNVVLSDHVRTYQNLGEDAFNSKYRIVFTSACGLDSNGLPALLQVVPPGGVGYGGDPRRLVTSIKQAYRIMKVIPDETHQEVSLNLFPILPSYEITATQGYAALIIDGFPTPAEAVPVLDYSGPVNQSYIDNALMAGAHLSNAPAQIDFGFFTWNTNN